MRRGEGAGLRRSPQGHAAGHRRPHRREGIFEDLEDLGDEIDKAPSRRPRPREEGHRHQGRHHDHRGRRQEGEDIEGAHRADPAEIEDTSSDYDREKLQERLAKLAGGVAVIKVGAATEVEMKEKKARVEDALQRHTRRARRGRAAGRRNRARCKVEAPCSNRWTVSGDEKVGVDIVRRALSGADASRSPRTVASTVQSSPSACSAPRTSADGYNADTDTYGESRQRRA